MTTTTSSGPVNSGDSNACRTCGHRWIEHDVGGIHHVCRKYDCTCRRYTPPPMR